MSKINKHQKLIYKMALKRHHKILIGGFSSIVFIFMVISGVALYSLYMKQNIEYTTLNAKVTNIQENINTLTTSLIETKQTIEETANTLNLKIGSVQDEIQQELSQVKASVSSDFSDIVEISAKSVVTVRTDYSQGTGFIINNDGYIVTNAHVLADSFGKLATGIKAVTYEQETKTAEFIGYNGDFDVALLKISGDYDSLTLADSDDVQVGEKVIAIGNPLGLQFSVSEGIVSAVHRKGSNNIEAYIQTDASLNPGNSGGPLINKKGEAIGINNFKIGNTEGLGFALESNYIKSGVNTISQETLGKNLV